MCAAVEKAVTPEDVVRAVRGWIGTPYHHQASVRGVGVDCLGLVRGVWLELYGKEAEEPPPYAADWAEATGREAIIEAARRHLVELATREPAAGDVLVFRYRDGLPAKHVGIATDHEHFVHAIEGVPVSEVALVPWWRRRVVGVFAFPKEVC